MATPPRNERAAGMPPIEMLRQFYGLQPTPPADLFQFFVWEILSEKALPARRDHAWQVLRRIPALTPDAMFRAPAKALLDAIGMAGPHREEKLESIRAVVGEFKRHRDQLSTDALAHGTTLAAGRRLRKLDHVPRSSHGRALLYVLGRLVLPLDDEVLRVVGRLMAVPGIRRRATVRHWIATHVPMSLGDYRDAITYLRHHAEHTCLKAGPHCGVCPLRTICGSVQRSDAPA